MTHLLRKEGERYFIYFGEPRPEMKSLDSIKNLNEAWIVSCKIKGNRVEVAKDQEGKFYSFASGLWFDESGQKIWMYDDYMNALKEGIEIPLCYEVRELDLCKINCPCPPNVCIKYSEPRAYFKEPVDTHEKTYYEDKKHYWTFERDKLLTENELLKSKLSGMVEALEKIRDALN